MFHKNLSHHLKNKTLKDAILQGLVLQYALNSKIMQTLDRSLETYPMAQVKATIGPTNIDNESFRL